MTSEAMTSEAMTDGAADRGSRGRVVMLVDNSVVGDSRVQKVARSAADAGWDSILLGCAVADEPRSWKLGAAEVRVLPLFGVRPRVASAAPARGPRAGAASAGGARAGAAARPRQLLPTGVRRRLPAGVRDGLRQQRRRVRQLRRRVRQFRDWMSDHDRMPRRTARLLIRRPVQYAQLWFWSATKGDRAWRWLEPGLWNYEHTFADAIDELAPDVIHAHDFRMVGVAVRAAQRARAAGRRVAVVWDAHEWVAGVRPGRDDVRWLPAHRAYVREYAPLADAVVTVSETLADMLQREHGLGERPTVVLNAPVVPDGPIDEPGPDVRQLSGLDRDTPLMVYAGIVMPHRGLDTVVDALPQLPGVHLALVAHERSRPVVRRLVRAAAALGAADRVHVLPFVSHEQVVSYLSGADVGLIPLHHWSNYEIALTTKFFEYSHARLPIVVSDVKTMAETVRATGQGEVFRAQDVDDFARAARAVLADPGRYRDAYERPGCLLPTWTWQAQAQVLDSLYDKLAAAARAEA
jgi:glycogen synthase